MERQLICTAGRWNTSLRGQTERVGVVQPGEEKAPRRAGGGLSVPKWGYKKKNRTDCLAGFAVIGQGKFISNQKSRREIFRLDTGKNFFNSKVVEALEQFSIISNAKGFYLLLSFSSVLLKNKEN